MQICPAFLNFSNSFENTALIMAEKTILTNEEVTLEVSFASKSG